MKLSQYKLVIVFTFGIFGISCEFAQIDFQEPIPTALPAEDITSSSFRAVWNAIEGSGSYTVLVSTSNSLDEGSIIDGYPATTNQTSLVVADLAADQTYYYRVKVTSDNPREGYSETIMVNTLPLPPPIAIDASDITPLSFTAQWLSVPEAESYRLYVARDANFSEYVDGYAGKIVTDTTESVENLTVDNDYFYRVRSLRGSSESVDSDLIRVRTSALRQPVLSEATDIDFTSATINWEVVDGASSYLVFVSTDPFVITEVLPDYNPREVSDALSAAIVGLNANTTYYYRVQAKNDQSESEKSEIGQISTISLGIPVALPPTQVQIDNFQANWDSVSNASSYLLDVSGDESFTSYIPGYQGKEIIGTNEIIEGLSRNTPYYYRVRAKGFGAVSANSNIISVRTASFASPRALEATDLQSTSFRAVWQPVSDADSYRLDVATDANFTNILGDYQDLEVADTTQVVSDLTVNQRYFYRVRALKGSVFSGYSNIIVLTTTNLAEPTLLAPTGVQLTEFTINWSSVTGATGYRVDIGFDPLVENKIGVEYDNRQVSGTSLTVNDLDANTTYYYKVRAENDMSTGGSATGSVKTASIGTPTALSATDVQLTSFQANWSSTTNTEGYLLDVATDAAFNDLVAGFNAREIIGSANTSIVVTGLEPNTTYYYRVRAKGLGSTSEYSNSVSVATPPLPSPVVLAASDQQVYAFTANWEEVIEADSYLLFIATDASFAMPVSGYDGKAVLGTSYTVEGLDPYTTYYYRLQSRKSSTVSAVSSSITVDACIGSTCQLTQREFVDWRREDYGYTDENLTSISLHDITGADVLLREATISYVTGENRVSEVDITYPSNPLDNQRWEFAYEEYATGQYRIDSILIKDSGGILNLGQYNYSYDAFNRVSSLQYTNLTDPLNPVVELEQNYTYSTDQVEVTDSSGDLVKELLTGDDFNTESLLPIDVALLLFNPTEPTAVSLPFIPENQANYYRYRDDGASLWNPYSYTYQVNDKEIPNRVLPINGIPELIYRFSGGCTF
ncbi:MAG: fibronectin type III domain-containing protein [Bacteroidota bacterium]